MRSRSSVSANQFEGEFHVFVSAGQEGAVHLCLAGISVNPAVCLFQCVAHDL